MDARAFKILKALLGCGRSPDKAETTGPNQKQTKSEADNDVRCCHPGGGAMASTMSRIRPTMAEDSAAERFLNGNLEKTMAYRAGPMSIDRVVLAFAGTLVLISLALSQIHSPYWLWLTAFVGANMLQSAFTGFCPLVKVLKRLGVRPGQAFS